MVRHVAETILCSPLTEALRSCHQPGLQHLITKQAMGVIAQTLNVPEHSEQLPEGWVILNSSNGSLCCTF